MTPKPLTPEQQAGLEQFEQEFQARVKRIAERWNGKHKAKK